MSTLEKAYEPQKVEKKIYNFWMKNDLFKAKINENKKPFTIVMPPPNITGRLHVGHALDTTIQDVLIRYKRMQGYETLWIPGTDHSALATEVKIVKELKKNGTSKETLGRKGFLKYANDWKIKYQAIIREQIKSLGASCDWSRERFTMDEGCNRAVNEFFIDLYEKGHIYRGKKIINWCPHCHTSIADSEVDYVSENTNLYFLKYKFPANNEFLTVATTRPETIFGDVAVAVNPNDERYKNFVGKNVIVPIVNREVPIIADSHVETEFGTGVLKITPAHAMDDFEIGLKHNLKIIDTIDKHGNLNEKTDIYKGMDRFYARKQIISDLQKKDLLVKKEELVHNIGTCYRCNTIVEPRISTQWFVKMKNFAKSASMCIKNGDTSFIPKRFEKTFFHWMDNIKDWCISRQIWWGHRIPIWYCKKCKNIMPSKTDISNCSKCGSDDVYQDEDTLDTWFSSGLWPFSVLGWPEKNADLDYFFPTSVLVTGYDILFFWVAKMIFSSIAMTGKKPFDTVYFHGLIRDSKGRKMSKSLSNGIDPIDMVAKYGADALRISLLTGNSPGNDICFSEEKLVSNRNFMNKIWNAARFILINTSENINALKTPHSPGIIDQWIIIKLKNAITEITKNIEKFEFGLAVEKIHTFIWNDFCDWYLEFAKIALNSNDNSIETKNTMVFVFKNILKILHPFAPFITEQIWQFFSYENSSSISIMNATFPDCNILKNIKLDDVSFQNTDLLIDVIRKIRNKKNQFKSLDGKETILTFKTKNKFLNNTSITKIISKLTKIPNISVFDSEKTIKNGVKISLKDVEIFISNNEKFDTHHEIERLKKELIKLKEKSEKIFSQINNKNFMEKAPKNITEKIRQNAQNFENQINSISTDIEFLEENI